MPQMSPLSWLILFSMFSISFLIFNIMNFFLFSPKFPLISIKKNSLKTLKKNKNFNWSW